jgi:hypothetical protein
MERLDLADTGQQLTVQLMRSKLTPKELRWFDLDVAYHGEAHIRWPALSIPPRSSVPC